MEAAQCLCARTRARIARSEAKRKNGERAEGGGSTGSVPELTGGVQFRPHQITNLNVQRRVKI